jgi:SAM-dependent methyltransferase
MTRLDEPSESDLLRLSPSSSIKKFGKDIVLAAGERPILDVACGGGRNSAWISHLGGHVTGIDIDLHRIEMECSHSKDTLFAESFSRIELLKLDLIRGLWPYRPGSVGGIINIHFLHKPLLSAFSESLFPGGFLVLETIEGRGGNYRQLPKAGSVRAVLECFFTFLVYKERQVGPEDIDAVTVRLVAQRH